MDATKAERLEKHKKEIRRMAYLEILLGLLFAFGLGLVLWGPVADILNLFIGGTATFATILVLIGVAGLVYMMPLLHFKEENEVRSDKDPEYYLNRGLDELPFVELIESQGWDEVETTEEKIKLETYPSFLHKFIGEKSTAEIEITEKEGHEETVVLSKNGKDLEKMKTRVEAEEDGSYIKETGVSLRRYSPAYLEIMLFILPQVQETLKQIADEKLELADENIKIGLTRYKLESE